MILLSVEELSIAIAEQLKARGVVGKIIAVWGVSGSTTVGINGIRIDVENVELPPKEGPLPMNARELRKLVGRTIVKVEANAYRDVRAGWVHDPTITLDDGSRLRFIVQETEGGEYGVEIVRHGAPARGGGVP